MYKEKDSWRVRFIEFMKCVLHTILLLVGCTKSDKDDSDYDEEWHTREGQP